MSLSSTLEVGVVVGQQFGVPAAQAGEDHLHRGLAAGLLKITHCRDETHANLALLCPTSKGRQGR
jgi:hypothetical protein